MASNLDSGSYLIREFAKHVESVRAYDEAGRILQIKRAKTAGDCLTTITSSLRLNMMFMLLICRCVGPMLIRPVYTSIQLVCVWGFLIKKKNHVKLSFFFQMSSNTFSWLRVYLQKLGERALYTQSRKL